MPSTDDLHAADQKHAVAIAELRARIDGHDEAIERHERHIAKLDETVTVLREAYGKVATTADINGLRDDIANKFDSQLRDAQRSIPEKVAVVFSGGMFLIAIITLFVSLVHNHG